MGAPYVVNQGVEDSTLNPSICPHLPPCALRDHVVLAGREGVKVKPQRQFTQPDCPFNSRKGAKASLHLYIAIARTCS